LAIILIEKEMFVKGRTLWFMGHYTTIKRYHWEEKHIKWNGYKGQKNKNGMRKRW
jgi:hypothetical protein